VWMASSAIVLFSKNLMPTNITGIAFILANGRYHWYDRHKRFFILFAHAPSTM
jgi:hypothetical protein